MKQGTERLDGAVLGPGRYQLAVIEGPDRGRKLTLDRAPIEVGTDASCALTLTDAAVSARHARLAVDESGGIMVEDLGSTNGTRYREVLVHRVTIGAGAMLRLGRTVLLLGNEEDRPDAPRALRDHYGRLLGTSRAMQALYASLEQLESSETPVLLLGETGVGKERVAEEIHRRSRRAGGPFEVFDCGAVPPSLIESELFGHTKGAFTGALTDHRGVFERAHDGTLLLDELGDLPLELQPRLLRALESGTIRRLGSEETTAVDVRIVAATNRDLDLEVAERRFRSDLYYRVNVVQLDIPPLRARREDIPLLVEQFASEEGRSAFTLSGETLELLTSGYDWPGNVRELRNAVRSLSLGHVPRSIQSKEEKSEQSEPGRAELQDRPYAEARKAVLEAFERDYVRHHLRQAVGNLSRAARSAGMDRAYFRRLSVKHGLLESDG